MAYSPSVAPPVEDEKVRRLLEWVENEFQAIARELAALDKRIYDLENP